MDQHFKVSSCTFYEHEMQRLLMNVHVALLMAVHDIQKSTNKKFNIYSSRNKKKNTTSTTMMVRAWVGIFLAKLSLKWDTQSYLLEMFQRGPSIKSQQIVLTIQRETELKKKFERKFNINKNCCMCIAHCTRQLLRYRCHNKHLRLLMLSDERQHSRKLRTFSHIHISFSGI